MSEFPLVWSLLGCTREQANGTLAMRVNPHMRERNLKELPPGASNDLTAYHLNMLENALTREGIGY